MKESVAVIGLGYVGLPLALLAQAKGYEVIGFDIDTPKVNQINKGRSPIDEKTLHMQLKKYPVTATNDINKLKGYDIFVVCVPTPVKNHTEPDLGPLRGAVTAVAGIMSKGSLLVIESTVNPGVCDEVVIPLVKEISGLTQKDFEIVHCPERINPGDPHWNVSNINRVLGSNSQRALDRALRLYSNILNAEIKPMNSLKEAEAVKVVENSFRDINIAFVNELAMSFQRMGIDIENVIDGAATKPFAFMPHHPGAGVGGHCIPVDPYYLIQYARNYNFNHDLLSLARRINSGMPEFTVELLQDALNKSSVALNDSPVALLGLSYKRNVDDDRESPSYEIAALLNKYGVEVRTFDPYFPAASSHKTLQSCLKGAVGVIVATDHDEFIALSPKDYETYGAKAVIDGRNAYRHQKNEFKKHGIVYRGIGVIPEA